MRITELYTEQSIALDEAQQDRSQIIDRLVELQATHGNIKDKEAYKKGLYAREDEGSTYVDIGISVPHAKCDCVTRPSLAALRLSTPVQYNAEDDGKTDLLFAIAAPQNGSLHVDMLARMMQMLMNEDFVEKLRTAKPPADFLAAIDAQEEAQFGDESFTDQEVNVGYRVLAVTACVNGIAHTYMAAEALNKAGAKMGVPIKVETNGSDGAKNLLTKDEIANCDGIIVAAEKKIETARFDGKPVLFARVDDGIHKPEELIKKIVHGEVPVYHAEGGAQAAEDASGKDSFGRTLYKNLMNGVSHMLPFVVGGGIMIALAFLLDDYTIDPSNFGMNTPVAAFFKTVGSAAFGYMLPILSAFIAMSIADRPGLAVGFAGGVLAMNGTNFAGFAAGETTGVSGGFLAALLAGAMSACFSLGLESGSAIQAAAVAAGVKELFALNPVILLVTLGGVATNAAYCIFCNVKNRTGRAYFSVPAGVWVNNVLFCALAGVLWYWQFFGRGMGKSFFAEAPLMLAFSWSILMSLNVLFSNLWGILLHEWRGVDRRTAAVLVTGLLILIFSTVYPQLEK